MKRRINHGKQPKKKKNQTDESSIIGKENHQIQGTIVSDRKDK